MSVDSPTESRAGFWRRSLAYMIDVMIVWMPFQIIAAVLFAATSGWVQETGGITIKTCVMGTQIPDALAPPPPAGSNFTRECHVYFFGAETARYVQVGRSTKEGSTTKDVWRTYILDRQGHPIDGFSLDWFALLAFVAYVLAMETQTGATLGDIITRIRVRDMTAIDAPGVPLRRIIIRNLTMFAGLAPMLAVFLFYLALYGGDIEAIFAANAPKWIALAAIPALAWAVVVVVQIVSKRDPLYDKFAGTAVVRV